MTPLEEARFLEAHPEAWSVQIDGDSAFWVTVVRDGDGAKLALHKSHADCAETEPHRDCLLGLSAPFRAAIIAHRRT